MQIRTGNSRQQRILVREGARILAAGSTGLTGEASLTIGGLAPGEHAITVNIHGEPAPGQPRVLQVLGEPLAEAAPTDFWMPRESGIARRHITVADQILRIDGIPTIAGGVTAATAVDWNLDGRTDLLYIAQSTPWLATALPDGTFTAARPMSDQPILPGTITNLAAGDWNGDGANDLLAGTEEAVLLLAGGENATLALQFRQPGFRLPAGRIEADWNADGVPDIIVLQKNATGDQPAVWLGDGRGGFLPQRMEATPRQPSETKTANLIRAAAPAPVDRAATAWGNTSYGNIYTIAGTGSYGFSGDGGLATSAQLAQPGAIALDSTGNVYFADTGNNRIRRINVGNRTIETVAGSGLQGSTNDNVPALSAVLFQPRGLALDSLGNLYIAESGAGKIRRVAAGSGIITTIAGNGSASSGGDGGPATAAQLYLPSAVAIDTARNIYIAEGGGSKVRRVDGSTGIISTFAGTGTPGFSGDDGPATAAQFGGLTGISVDENGNVYVADTPNNRIRRIDGTSRVITTVAGNGSGGNGGEGISALASSLNGISTVAADGAGGFYIVEYGGQRVRRVSGGIIRTVAGTGNAGYDSDGGPAATAMLYGPTGVAIDGSGNLYISDTNNNRIRFVDRASPFFAFAAPGAFVADTAGNSNMQFVTTPAGAAWTAAKDAAWLTLTNPVGAGSGSIGFSFSRNFSLYSRTATITVNNVYSFTVTQAGAAATIDVARRMVSAAAGNGSIALTVAAGVPWTVNVQGSWISASPLSGTGPATINYTFPANAGTAPRMGQITAAGQRFALLQIGATGDYSIFGKIGPGIIQTIVGTGVNGDSGDGGPPLAARIAGAYYISLDGQGNFYFANGNRIRWVSAATGLINTFAGTGGVGYFGDGAAASGALFRYPGALAIDGKGDLYIYDSLNERIRKISAATGIITTIAGTGTRGTKGDGGLATLAELDSVIRMAADGLGNLYIWELYSRRVRQIHGETGIIRTVAGSGIEATPTDGALATQSGFFSAQALTAALNGDLYLSGGGYLSKWSSTTGLLSVIAGNQSGQSTGDGGPVQAAGFYSNSGISVDTIGELFIGDGARIRRVSPNGIIDTVAGVGGLADFSGDGGPAVAAQIGDSGTGVADPVGNLYLDHQNSGNYRIRFVSRFTPDVTLGAASAAATATAGSGAVPVTVSPVGGGWAAYSSASWLTVTPGGQGPEVTYTFAANTGIARSATLTIGGKTFTVNQAAGTLPSVISGAPVNPVGSPQVFTFVGRDPDGRNDISRMSFVAGASATSNAATCSGYYDRTANGLYLYNDAGNALLGPVTPGTGGTIQNSQCTLNGAASSVPSGSGLDLTLNVSLSLLGAYATTPQTVWFSVRDNAGNDTGWVQTGIWMPASLNRAPVIVSASPVAPSGSPNFITVVARDPDGFVNLSRVSFLIGPSAPPAAGSCYGYYDRAANAAFLLDETLTNTYGPSSLGGNQGNTNAVCALNAGPSSVSLAANGTDLTVSLSFSLFAVLGSAPQKIFVSVRDINGNDTGWVETGIWYPAGYNAAPVITGGSPTNALSADQNLSIFASDANGYSTIRRVDFLVSTSSTALANACRGYYDRAANNYYLYADDGTTPLGPITGGGTAKLENSQCIFYGNSYLSETHNATGQSIQIPLSLKPAFAAVAHFIYGRVQDQQDNDSGWVQTGVWAATNSDQPSVVGASPSSYSGNSLALTFTGRDPNGFADIARIYFLIKPNANGAGTPVPTAGSCHGFYDQPSNSFFLYNDALTALSGPLAPGSAGTLQNSLCTLYGSASSPITGTGTDLAVKAAFSLPIPVQNTGHSVFAYVVDKAGNGTGWVETGSWTTLPSIGGNPPVLASAAPGSPSGSPQTFNLVARDPDGAADLNRVYFLVNTDATVPANTCHGFYDRAANAFYLYADGLSTLLGPVAPGAASTLQNSQCILNGAVSSATATGATDLTLNLGLSLKPSFAATTKNVYTWIVDNANTGTGWVKISTWSPASQNQPPTVVQGTPTNPTGSPQVFQFAARDADGFADIRRVYFLVNPNANVPANTCHGFYDRLLNAFYLYSDGLATLTGPLAPGAAGTLQNSQCTLSGAASAPVTGSGTDLSMSLGLTLSNAYGASAKIVYLWVTDSVDNGTGWTQIATWAPASASQPPSLVSASPSTVAGSPQTFTLLARDPNGYTDLQRVYFVVNTAAAVPANSCHGFYDRAANAFYLYNDALTALLGPLAPGAAGTLQNGQCTIDGATSTPVTGSGTDLTLTLGLRLSQSFGAAAKNLYIWVTDNEANGTGWIQAAAWNATAANQPPTLASAAPATLSGLNQAIMLTARDANGAADIQRVYFVVNPSPAVPANSCHGFYDRALNAFYLYNDALTTLLGPLTPGATGTLQNTQCTIDGPASAPVTASGTDLTVTLNLRLSSAFGATSKNLYAWITDAAATGTGWVQAASWPAAISSQPPQFVAATPSTAAGYPQTFSLLVRDPNGYTDLQRVYFVANTSASAAANTCHGFYDRAVNAFYLYNDALTTLLGPLTPGAAGTLQNSQCTIDGPASSPAASAGTDLTITLALTLANGFRSPAKNLYLWVTDNEANGTGWVKASDWTAPVVNQAPVFVGVASSSLTGTSQYLTVTARDPNGYLDLRRIYFVVNTNPSVPVNSCHGFYDRIEDAIFLYNDSLTTLLGPLKPGSATLQNSQCTISGGGSGLSLASGADLTESIPITLKGTFATGNKNVYVWITDASDAGTGWVQAATWTLP